MKGFQETEMWKYYGMLPSDSVGHLMVYICLECGAPIAQQMITQHGFWHETLVNAITRGSNEGS